MRRAIFLDRDGTINEDLHYLHEAEKVILCPEAGKGLRLLADAGYELIVITNQSGVGRGYFPIEDVYQVNRRLDELLEEEGVHILKYYIAPESPDEPSLGRKPLPGFVYQARDEFELDLNRSFFIGDKRSDLETGWNAGLQGGVLVRTGKGSVEEKKYPELRQKAYICDNLREAAEYILREGKERERKEKK